MQKNVNVTIVGGGFGGVKTALEIAKNKSNQVTLISDRDYFQYYPALFSTATGHSYRESWVPLTNVFEGHSNVKIIQDTITSIDMSAKLLKGASSYHYESAVLALGSVTSYFGIEGLDTFSYGIKSQEEIRRLQDHLWRGQRMVVGQLYDWKTAKAYCASLQYQGKPWRLPKVNELKSLVDLNQAASKIDPVAFPQTAPKIFWSATPDASTPGEAMGMDFHLGKAEAIGIAAKKYVRCVSNE